MKLVDYGLLLTITVLLAACARDANFTDQPLQTIGAIWVVGYMFALDRNPGKIKIIAQLIFQISFIGFLNVLREVRKKGKRWCW